MQKKISDILPKTEILIYNRYMEKVIKIEYEKEARWLSRLEAKENKNG